MPPPSVVAAIQNDAAPAPSPEPALSQNRQTQGPPTQAEAQKRALADYARSECKRRKITNSAHVAAVERFSELSIPEMLIDLKASHVLTETFVGKVVFEKNKWVTPSREFEANMMVYATKVLLSTELVAYRGEYATASLERIVRIRRFGLPPNLELDAASWKLVHSSICYAVTQKRAMIKKEIIKSFKAMEVPPAQKKHTARPPRDGESTTTAEGEATAGQEDDLDASGEPSRRQFNPAHAVLCDSLETVARRLVKGINKTITLELLARIAIMRYVYITDKYHDITYWPAVDRELRELRKLSQLASNEDEAMTRGLKDYILHDINTYGSDKTSRDLDESDEQPEADETELDKIIGDPKARALPGGDPGAPTELTGTASEA